MTLSPPLRRTPAGEREGREKGGERRKREREREGGKERERGRKEEREKESLSAPRIPCESVLALAPDCMDVSRVARELEPS